MENWDSFFERERRKERFRELLSFLDAVYAGEKKVYPPKECVFRAFAVTPLESVRVVLLGQDPYHEPGQAQGLSFSVANGVKAPPSLRNMFKELRDDLGVSRGERTDLIGWAEQGVLLLNVYLTVEEGRALSHASDRYRDFAKDVIDELETLDQPIVYLLWGKFAQSFASRISNPNHLVLQSAHPSPLSANRGGFFGTKPYSKANAFLLAHGESPVDWSK